ncbi:MAG: DUF3179 domain-containing protein [Acidimicrobiia bacterium]|nr:DUF3179 domain-containing protein [Acidimicrobiia bacterium]
MVHRRSIDGMEVVFGVQGALLGNAMTFWDHDTGSIWTQPTGKAVAGPRRGQELEVLPVSFTSWDAWRELHPETLALDVPAGISGFALERMAIVLELASDAVAYPYLDLVEAGVVNDEVGGLEVAVVVDPTDDDRWETFARRLDDRVLTFIVENGSLVDVETGTTWDPNRGIALDGPLAGEVLAVLPGFTIFPDDFGTFWPEGRIWQP